MSRIPHWRAEPLTWDCCYVDERLLPGTCTVTVKQRSRLDARKPPGYHNEVLSDNGKPLATGEIELTLGFDAVQGQPWGTAEEQWDEWQTVQEEVIGRKVASQEAVSVSHPEFQLAGVNRVCLEKTGSMEGTGPGARRIKIPWREYAKIVPASSGTGKGGTIGAQSAKAKQSTAISQLAKPSVKDTAP